MKAPVIAVAAGLILGAGMGATAAENAKDVIADWPAKPKEAAEATIAKYGQPDGITSQKLMWMNKGPWKAIIVHRQEVPHSFPMAHTDLLKA